MQTIAKALIAGLSAEATGISGGALDSLPKFVVTTLLAVCAGLAVYVVPNKPAG